MVLTNCQCNLESSQGGPIQWFTVYKKKLLAKWLTILGFQQLSNDYLTRKNIFWKREAICHKINDSDFSIYGSTLWV